MTDKSETINGFDTSYDLVYNGNDWLTKKDIGIQSIDYGYNSRGWLTRINTVTDQLDDEPDPCDEPEVTPPPFDIDCDELLDIVTTYLISINCTRSNPNGNVEIQVTRQYFDGEERVALESQLYSSTGVASGEDFEEEMEFTVGDDVVLDDLNAGIVNALIDCIQNNPNLLTEINELINQMGGGPTDGSGGDLGEDDDVAYEPTNNKDDVFGMQLHYYNEERAVRRKIDVEVNLASELQIDFAAARDLQHAWNKLRKYLLDGVEYKR